jgi:hypothetical protein
MWQFGMVGRQTGAVFAGRPEHEVSRRLSRDGVAHFPILSEVDPFGTDAHHELCVSAGSSNPLTTTGLLEATSALNLRIEA